MAVSRSDAGRAGLFVACALGALSTSAAASAASDPSTTVNDVVVTATKTTRSSVTLGGQEMQKILPGVNPLKAIQTLPGVLFVTADPWGNNEQNEVVFVHGFSTQQLGYTLDGVPLGDQAYGNYNGLSVARAVTSENVANVVLSSGAGNLGVASTSNLGGAIETFSSDPSAERGGRFDQTVGSYDATRTFLRLESGTFAGNNSAYLSFVHQDQRAWDFNGHQRGNQINSKLVHDDSRGKLTVFFDWQDKVEPNEDATNHHTGEVSEPYTRPFLYPNYAAGLAAVNASGAPTSPLGNNFSNYYSAAQRTDYLSYAKYDFHINPNITWSNQVYYHHDAGRGLVAGPVNQAGLPALFAVYFPGQNLVNVFGGTGYEVRETEYLIAREGVISTLNWHLGDHDIEAGGWFENIHSQTDRVWFPFLASSNDLSPYNSPTNAAFTQYESKIHNKVFVAHLQDQWRIEPNLLLLAGFKSSLQYAFGKVPIQQKNLPGATGASQTLLPTGEIDTTEAFLPEVGAVWDVNANDQLFVNVQKNVRQYITYGASGLSPWSLGSQAAFNLFKTTAHPETSWTYELGVRAHHNVEVGPLSAVEGQVSLYHVDFANRLLQIAAFNFINPGASILANVGDVRTDGIDIAGTAHFGPHVSVYNAVSYNRSVYGSNYSQAGATVGGVVQPSIVHTSGKWVPDSPDWLNKTVASANYGDFEGQLIGDYVGRRFATYLNDLQVKATFTLELEASYRIPVSSDLFLKAPKISLNMTNITGTRGVSSLGTPTVSGIYTAYPIAPRQVFVTFSTKF